jgi:hypothetical protein
MYRVGSNRLIRLSRGINIPSILNPDLIVVLLARKHDVYMPQGYLGELEDM